MRVVCWIKGHEWGGWTRGVLIRYRYCQRCPKRQVESINRA